MQYQSGGRENYNFCLSAVCVNLLYTLGMRSFRRWVRSVRANKYWPLIVVGILAAVVALGLWLFIIFRLKPIANQPVTQPSNTAATPVLAPTAIDQAKVRKLVTAVMTGNCPATTDFAQGCLVKFGLVDGYGRAVAADSDIIITLSSSNPSGKFDSGTQLTLSSGATSATARYVATRASSDTLTGFVSELGTATAQVSVGAGAASQISAISPNQSDYALNQSYTFTVVVTDQFGNPVAGQAVNWTVVASNGTNVLPSPQPAATDAAGQSTFSYTFTVPDSYTLTADPGGLPAQTRLAHAH